MPVPGTSSVLPNNRMSASHSMECSPMWTARPAARPSRPFFKFRAHPFNMLSPCLILLDGGGPADPLIARERCYVFPSHQCLRVRRERLSEISRDGVYYSSRDSKGCHRVISRDRMEHLEREYNSHSETIAGNQNTIPVIDRRRLLGSGKTPSCSMAGDSIAKSPSRLVLRATIFAMVRNLSVRV